MNPTLLRGVGPSPTSAINWVGIQRRIGYVESASSFTTASTAAVDVTGMAVTVVHTRTGNLTYRCVVPAIRTSTANAYVLTTVVRDGANADYGTHTSATASAWGGLVTERTLWLAAGTYAFKLQTSTSAGTAVLNENALSFMVLTVFEDIA
jgi:hypothetical protein